MSDVKSENGGKDVELKDISKDVLQAQVEKGRQYIGQIQQEIARLQNELQQQVGILGFSEHLLAKFKWPETPKAEPKKPELEVK